MVIEFTPEEKQEGLNGLFSFIGRGKSNDTSDASAKNLIEDIKKDNGFNDLMYMQPEQASTTLNAMIIELTYNEELQNSHAKSYKTTNSKEQALKHAKYFSDATANVMSQFRQYALGMDGEVKKIGASEKERDGFKFECPYYKLVLPVTVQGTTPVDAVSKDDLLAILEQQATTTTVAPAEASNKTLYIVGAGVGALVIIGGIMYSMNNKNKNSNQNKN